MKPSTNDKLYDSTKTPILIIFDEYLSIMEGKAPNFREKPEMWLKDKTNNQEPVEAIKD
jgi:hypothetical protein